MKYKTSVFSVLSCKISLDFFIQLCAASIPELTYLSKLIEIRTLSQHCLFTCTTGSGTQCFDKRQGS